jgi:hypothetical protein
MNKVIVNDKELDRDLVEQLYYCISCRLGIIETGEPSIRTEDAIRSGQHKLIKPLSTEQKELVLQLEKLMYSLI